MDTCVLLASDDENTLTITNRHTQIGYALLQFKGQFQLNQLNVKSLLILCASDSLPNSENKLWLVSSSTAEVKSVDDQSIALEVRRGFEEKHFSSV
jgi:hypothetical protein